MLCTGDSLSDQNIFRLFDPIRSIDASPNIIQSLPTETPSYDIHHIIEHYHLVISSRGKL